MARTDEASETIGEANVRAFDVLGVPVSAVDQDEAIRVIEGWIDRREPHYVCVTGVHGVMEARQDPALLRILEHAGLVTPDGMPLVWMAHLTGYPRVRRVYGPDLMLALCDRSVQRGLRHFLYGGTEEVLDRLRTALNARFPGIRIAGSYSPPFRPLHADEDAAVVARIVDCDPDIVWVGLSTPKQEHWMAAHVNRLNASVLIGVGAAFDFHAGVKAQAPIWMRRNGLEWAFRLATEPRRLWRRYLKNNPRFVVQAARQLVVSHYLNAQG